MEENSSQSNKYDAALAKYNTNLSDADIQARVADLIEKKVPENNTEEVKKLLFNCIDLTTLAKVCISPLQRYQTRAASTAIAINTKILRCFSSFWKPMMRPKMKGKIIGSSKSTDPFISFTSFSHHNAT